MTNKDVYQVTHCVYLLFYPSLFASEFGFHFAPDFSYSTQLHHMILLYVSASCRHPLREGSSSWTLPMIPPSKMCVIPRLQAPELKITIFYCHLRVANGWCLPPVFAFASFSRLSPTWDENANDTTGFSRVLYWWENVVLPTFTFAYLFAMCIFLLSVCVLIAVRCC